MTVLVVNADDAGADLARNRGILHAFEHGVVRSASVLAGSPAAEEFLKRARAARTGAGERLGVGLHLNLSEGKPLAPGHLTLVGEDGRFTGKVETWRRALSSRIDAAEVRREAGAQWKWLLDRGARPDHLDGHNHVHLLPGVAEALVQVLPSEVWMRLPREAVPAPVGPATDPADLFADSARLAGALAELSRRAEGLWRGRFRLADRFVGLHLLGGYEPRRLIGALSGLQGALVELMVHPGELDQRSVPFSAEPARRREVEALTSAELREFVRDARVTLSAFGAVP